MCFSSIMSTFGKNFMFSQEALSNKEHISFLSRQDNGAINPVSLLIDNHIVREVMKKYHFTKNQVGLIVN